jgi:hypothetical protein
MCSRRRSDRQQVNAGRRWAGGERQSQYVKERRERREPGGREQRGWLAAESGVGKKAVGGRQSRARRREEEDRRAMQAKTAKPRTDTMAI